MDLDSIRKKSELYDHPFDSGKDILIKGYIYALLDAGIVKYDDVECELKKLTMNITNSLQM